MDANRPHLFELLFGHPFSPGSPYLDAIPGFLKDPIREKVLPTTPLFFDAKTGSQLSWQRTKDDALKVASSLTQGPLQLRPRSLSDSQPSINRGSVISPVVLLHLPNSIQMATLIYGVLASGLTITMANPALTPTEISYVISKSTPSVIITTLEGLQIIQDAFELLAPSTREFLGFHKSPKTFVVDSTADDYGATAESLDRPRVWESRGWKVQDWKVLLPSNAPEFAPPTYVEGEAALRAAVIFWSSGTSGKSKGVILSHKCLGSAVMSLWLGDCMRMGERLIALPPFYHIFAWNILLMAPIVGATVSVVPKFVPHEYLKLVQESRATHLHIAPPVAVLLAKSPLLDGFDLSSVRVATSGGAPLGPQIIKEVYQRLGILIKIGYGLSETCGVTLQVGDTWEDLEKSLGSAGRSFPGNEISVRSVETGSVVNPGEPGEILIRSDSLLNCYLDNEGATSESLDNEGWFHTGDVGKLDAQGNLYIIDRLKDVIKVKGFQVAPAELEDTLCGSPHILDAGVSSIYHEEHATEYPRAYVVPADLTLLQPSKIKERETFAHLVRTQVEKTLVSYKWLRGGIVIVESIPKSPAGKILRRLLKNDERGYLIHVYKEKVRAKL